MKKILSSLRKKLTKRNIIYGIVTLLVLWAGWFLFFRHKDDGSQTLVAHAGDFVQQISVSGNVTSVENLNLSFPQSGIVRNVSVKVGDQVKLGQFLAGQDTGELYAELAQMQAGIDLQKAKLAQLEAGASLEDIKISEDAVTLAKQNLQDAYQDTLTTLSSAYDSLYTAYTTATYIKDTYFYGHDQQAIKVENSKLEISNNIADAKQVLANVKNNSTSDTVIDASIASIILDLNSTYDLLGVIRTQCQEDVYNSRVTASDKASLDTQKTTINNALSQVVSSKQAIASDGLSLAQAENQLVLKKAAPRDTDIAVFTAQIKQAEASAQGVKEKIRKNQIFSPIDGVVTVVNAKIGSVSPLNETAVSVISRGQFQIESYIPEIYVSILRIGEAAQVTLDAYGSETLFEAKVISIDPAQTIKDGVSTYKTTLQFTSSDDRIKTGMTANIVITTERKSNVISVPQGFVVTSNGEKIVKVKKGNDTIDQKVETGIISSSGYIEIISGLNEGDVVVSK